MEERRLNNILLHLSPSSRMLAGKSAICDILNGKRRSGAGADSLGDRWNFDDLPLPHRCKEDLRHQYESRDRMRARQHEDSQDQTVRGEHLLSSSSIGETAEGRFEKTAGQIEEDNSTYASYATLRGHVTSNSISCAPQLPEDLLSFGELTLKRCTGTEISRTTTGSFQYQIGREVGASAGRPMLHGDNGNASRKAALKFETEQEEGSERSKLVVESQAPDRERELKSNVGVTDLHVRITEKSFGDYTVEDNKDAKGLQGKGGRYKADNNERAAVTRSFFKSLFKQEAIHSMPSLPYSQALDCKNQAPDSMKVSRNNAMTGQRRITAEDCIFCLIVQGRSPAFKVSNLMDSNTATHNAVW